MPDYDKIAAKYGGSTDPSQVPDKYALLAQKYGGTAGDAAPVGPAPTTLEKIGHGIMDPINGGLRGVLHAALRAYFEVLDGYTLQDLVDKPNAVNRALGEVRALPMPRPRAKPASRA